MVLLKREPVNLMDLTMWQQLLSALDQLEADQVQSPPTLPLTHVKACRAGCMAIAHAFISRFQSTERCPGLADCARSDLCVRAAAGGLHGRQ